ncbi:ATP phosphoribosyltransferase regulatory subunit [Oecophyllibacter saccharovorans]|uniref:ATP phosphoribosyltransferase regulatory subunit n=1 Tax=Oecophyllibacter saccharovorans TaxID=2558360 RepID=UPI00117200B3|nr:ATP phosphoribosyltransferase regulatory subunit [Oecophyllibacter saccharovorans]TPW36340.1 ATP phosphoribosyltransferase regulatory subunit [Oecophyllibacter saccharovorans]
MNPLTDRSSPALLPMGFVDLLPGEAEAEAAGIAGVMEIFARHGYERVRPPLLEYESSLLSGAGEALAEQSFRLLDPASHRMMALRPDMTTQIARMASVRLSDQPRPLRLSYSGDCVQVGTAGRETDRQVPQVGLELIGPDLPAADAEVVAVGAEALDFLGIDGISFDLSIPALVWALLEEVPAAQRVPLVNALDRRDAAAVAQHAGAQAGLFLALIQAAGKADSALEKLEQLDLPEALAGHVQRLRASIEAIGKRVPGLKLTVDPADFRGWRYHTGICMTVFSTRSREELGRGGRYLAGNEPACGLTLRPQALLRVARLPVPRPRCLVPETLPQASRQALHEAGYATVSALAASESPGGESLSEATRTLARKLCCSHVWQNGKVQVL